MTPMLTLTNAVLRITAGFVFMILAVAGMGGCGRPSGKALAVVNGHAITEQDVAARFEKLNPSLRKALANDRRRLLEEMVLEVLLFQEARRRGMEQDVQVRELLREARKQIMIGRLLEIEGRERAEATDQAIAEFYEANKAQFTQPEQWRASQILCTSEEQAKAAMDRLGRGEPFEKVAAEMSQDPSKNRGGDIGSFGKGQLIPEFEEACMQLQVGQTSGIVKTSLGYHLIRLVDHQPAQQRGLSDVKEQIAQELKGRESRSRVDQFISRLRKKAQVFIRDDASRTERTATTTDTEAPAAVPNQP